jgi:uncharacterized protein YqeY
MIHEQIREEIKKAMLAKDAVRLITMRGLLAAFTNELVATRRTPQEILTDEQALKVIKRAANQRTDSIEQFEKGNRKDLADKEKAEDLKEEIITIIDNIAQQNFTAKPSQFNCQQCPYKDICDYRK